MLNYLKGSTQPEISMAVHWCARFFHNPRLVHECDVRRIAKCLVITSTYVDSPHRNRRLNTHGVFYRPYIEKVIGCYIYADFVGGWAQAYSDNAENSMSHTVYVITYAICLVLLCSRLQTEIALSNI